MSEEPSFEPTLQVPLAWIEELTGSAAEEPVELCLSYFPTFSEQAFEIGCTVDDIEADFRSGYVFRRIGTITSPNYTFDSRTFRIWAKPLTGRATGRPVVAIVRIEPHAEPRAMTGIPLKPLLLRPIRLELPAAPEVLFSYQSARQRLEQPAPFERPQAAPKAEESDGLWRYAAFAELLEVLRRRSVNAPRMRVSGKVLASDDLEGAENIMRMETTDSLKGWRADTLVQCSLHEGTTFRTSIREIDGEVLELEAPDRLAAKPGTPITIEQIPRFEMAAHKRALKQFLGREVAGNWEDLRNLLAEPGAITADFASLVEEPSRTPGQLTDEQNSAVAHAVSTPHTFFIQGPPGTGKTTVITEIVQRLVDRGERVLLLSSTNVAVDEVLRRVEKRDGVLPVRLTWKATKVDADVREYAYEHAVRALVKKVLRPKQDRDRFWAEHRGEGLTPGRIAELRAIEEKWVRGGYESGAEDALEEEIGEALLGAANLICATTIGVASKRFAHVGTVDTLIVDEASRVTDTEFLVGAVRARRWILVGDEHQLPPHVEPDNEHFLLALMACSMVERNLAIDLPSAAEKLAKASEEEDKLRAFRVDSVLSIAGPLLEGSEWVSHYRQPFNSALKWHGEGGDESFVEMLATLRYFLIQSLFERGVAACAEALRKRLTEQRRMIDPIARFVRDPVYNGHYRSPAPPTLAQLGVTPLVCQAFPMPVTFLNTEFREWDAAEEMMGTGFANPLEAEWIIEACDQFERGLIRSREAPLSVSILCFYRDQARRVQARLAERSRAYQKLNFRVIDAIDRIQGQESDLVFISFCRTRRTRHSMGPTFGMWLKDLRRLNVALTRARRALVLVGHRPTLARLGRYQPFYSHLLALFEQHSNDMQMIQDFGTRRRRR